MPGCADQADVLQRVADKNAGSKLHTGCHGQELSRINARTAKLQAELWSAVQVPDSAQPNGWLPSPLRG